MKKVLFVLLLMLLLSCSTKKGNEIALFNNISFEMHAGESLKDIHPSIKEIYTQYFNNNKRIQIPLFKYIKQKDYEIFIGIPYETSIDKMIKIQLEKPDSSRLFFESNFNYFFNKYKKDGFYVTEYSTLAGNSSLIYISTISDTKELSDSLLNKAEISKRIKLK